MQKILIDANLIPSLAGLILDELAKNGDLTNQVLQVDVRRDGRVQLERFALPAEEADRP